MKNNLDVDLTGASAFVDLTTQEIPCEIDEQADPMAAFIEKAQLAGALGRHGWETVEGLREEMRETEERLASLDKTRVPITFQKRLPDDWDQRLDDIAHDDSQRLEKYATSERSERKRHSYAVFIKREVARGESVAELVQYARAGGDPDAAELIADVAKELGL